MTSSRSRLSLEVLHRTGSTQLFLALTLSALEVSVTAAFCVSEIPFGLFCVFLQRDTNRIIVSKRAFVQLSIPFTDPPFKLSISVFISLSLNVSVVSAAFTYSIAMVSLPPVSLFRSPPMNILPRLCQRVLLTGK